MGHVMAGGRVVVLESERRKSLESEVGGSEGS